MTKKSTKKFSFSLISSDINQDAKSDVITALFKKEKKAFSPLESHHSTLRLTLIFATEVKRNTLFSMLYPLSNADFFIEKCEYKKTAFSLLFSGLEEGNQALYTYILILLSAQTNPDYTQKKTNKGWSIFSQTSSPCPLMPVCEQIKWSTDYDKHTKTQIFFIPYDYENVVITLAGRLCQNNLVLGSNNIKSGYLNM